MRIVTVYYLSLVVLFLDLYVGLGSAAVTGSASQSTVTSPWIAETTPTSPPNKVTPKPTPNTPPDFINDTKVAHNKTKVMYYAVNREAMGIAFGIVALMACMFGCCACWWCFDDKRDYITPTNHWDDEEFRMEQIYLEKETLNNTKAVHYNRAFDQGTDDDWRVHIDEPL